MYLMACDQSVRGFAVATAPLDWAGDWGSVRAVRFDGGAVERKAPDAAHRTRQRQLLRWFRGQVDWHSPTTVGFESYAFSSRPDVDVVELVGMCKAHLWDLEIDTVTINQSSARKLLLGKVPRKGLDAKTAVSAALAAAGAPARLTTTLDHTDALCILNAMLSDLGGYCFASP